VPNDAAYQPIAHLGGGATADVSLAKKVGSSDAASLCVIKRLKHGADADADLVTQLAEEAKLCARLDHSNIVKMLGTGSNADGPFIVLEYLDGQTLARIRSRCARRAGGMPRAIAINVVMNVLAALAYAHGLADPAGKPLKIVHRDVSPENIIVQYDGVTKLIDFSVAVVGPSTKSKTNATKGNIAYMAPEQAKSALNLDERADVFAVGLVLWELLAGRRMWEGLSEADVLTKLADEAPMPTLRSVIPDIPEQLDAICTQALAKIRDDRFDSAEDMRLALAKATKKLELRTTAAEIAEFMTSLFDDERTKMRQTVEEALASNDELSGALPRIRPRPPQSSSHQFADVETDPKLWATVRSPESDPSLATGPQVAPPRIVEIVRVEEKPSRDSRFTVLVIGAVLAAVAIVAVLALTSDKKAAKDDDHKLPTATARPTAAPTAAESAYVEPEEITIEISVMPRTATIYVDGVKKPSNPYRAKVVGGKFMHEIRAEADGYEPRSMKFPFDHDRTMEFVLVEKKPTTPPRRGAPPAPPPPEPKHE
jgi:serine/threonine protein kinase